MKKFFVLKIGAKDALTSFRKKGHLYANTLSYFSKLENDPDRSDSFETKDMFHDPKGWRITYPSSKTNSIVTLDDSNIETMATGTLRYDLLNVYCMYAISLDDFPVIPPIDKRVLGFGGHCVLVLNLATFIDRIKRSCQEHNIACRYGVVKYFCTKTYRGNRTPFQKPDNFAYQSEYRFVFAPSPPKNPFELFIGDISDITTQVSSSADLLNITFAQEEH
ncbi:MAG: hypothetical protein KKB30_17120 [Proteobacteria bacterium]|nr:hypothetical protein [Pseudomonadota bacterium]MBU1739889.1 hypothetical protein [Pseudomonadota bacterium]MBU1858219.1 hypothetical protein [Verrucomicrobiota bacterium]